MTTTLRADGYIVIDSEGVIHGIGYSRSEAGDDARRWLDEHDGLRTLPATAALLARIADHGGNTAWGRIGGVACTVAEEEG